LITIAARTIVTGALAMAAVTTWQTRTSCGDPDLHGEWTTEGEYGVPFERPAQYGPRRRSVLRCRRRSACMWEMRAGTGTERRWSTANLKAANRGSSPGLRLTERLTRTSRDAMQYQVTFNDPATWTAPWTAALDMKSRPDNAGVFEYACHEGNHGMSNMLSAARALERNAR
jgi:hypothetical protein